MLGAFLNKANQIEVKETQTPEPNRGEVRVKLSKVGICGSDVHLFLGHRIIPNPIIIGHEGIGIIDKLGEGVTGRSLGERVVIEPNIPCRNCKHCQAGRGNICAHKRVVGVNENGCFAEYVTIPADYAWSLPDTISDEEAVVIEPMAVAYSALFSSKAQPGDTIAIIGLGAIGLLLTHLACRLGYYVLVTEINQNKIKKATEMGAIPVIAAGEFNEQAQLLEKRWLEEGVSAIFECAGSEFTASLATSAAPRGAEIVLVGLSEKAANFQPLKIVREGVIIVPSIIYNHPFDFQRVIQLIVVKIIRPSFVISSHEPLQNLQSALEKAVIGEESKIIISI